MQISKIKSFLSRHPFDIIFIVLCIVVLFFAVKDFHKRQDNLTYIDGYHTIPLPVNYTFTTDPSPDPVDLLFNMLDAITVNGSIRFDTSCVYSLTAGNETITISLYLNKGDTVNDEDF